MVVRRGTIDRNEASSWNAMPKIHPLTICNESSHPSTHLLTCHQNREQGKGTHEMTTWQSWVRFYARMNLGTGARADERRCRW